MLKVKATKNKTDEFLTYSLWNAKKPNKKCKFCLNYKKLSCEIFGCVEKNNFSDIGKRTTNHLFLMKLTERRF